MLQTSERALENVIERDLLASGYTAVGSSAYDRQYHLFPGELFAFLEATQPAKLARLRTEYGPHMQARVLERISREIGLRGLPDVLRSGVKTSGEKLDLYYAAPVSDLNPDVAARHGQNRFGVVRQLHFSDASAAKSLDMALTVNGLPVVTLELKNTLTNQTVVHAMRQYELRGTREGLLALGRVAVHFAVDDELVRMTTHPQGEKTRWLPFDRGFDERGGNPPNPYGLKTAYLWQDVLTPTSLAELLERFAQLVAERDEDTGKKRQKMVFPRYHQREVVRALLADVRARGVGHRYLIQHAAGSGKSNSIAYLAHQLAELVGPLQDGSEGHLFDTVIVVTDRRVLDKQIRETIRGFHHDRSFVTAADKGAWQLREALAGGQKIIITTVQKFPVIVNEVGALPGRRFAIVIDEAHSSQSGSAARLMNETLSGGVQVPADGSADDDEDAINRVVEARRMLKNASYFAFTATPKNKTLQVFGQRRASDGKFVAFHEYTMRQAIDEKFIVDVLRSYTSYQSYFRLASLSPDDQKLFDGKQAQAKLRKYVEAHPQTIEQKARIMVEHFLSDTRRKMGGRAKAMVVARSIDNAIAYKRAFDRLLDGTGVGALVAFSSRDDLTESELSLNGFPGEDIPKEFRKPQWRVLIVAEKFQTGFDEPLLHTMYVDRPLSGVQAVQTLSRLNRAHPAKEDTFVLDFINSPERVQDSFEPYFRTAVLEREANVDRLHDLELALERAGVYTSQDVREFAGLYFSGAARDVLDPPLQRAAAAYVDLEADEQMEFKGSAKSFVRAYEFLSGILSFTNPDWERLNVFLRYLVTKLPTPDDTDNVRGLLERVKLDETAIVNKGTHSLTLVGDVEVKPVPDDLGRGMPEPELVTLMDIIKSFNDRYGLTPEQQRTIAELPAKIAQQTEYQNAKKNSGRQNAKISFARLLQSLFQGMFSEQSDLYAKFVGDKAFQSDLTETLFRIDYDGSGNLGGKPR